MTDAMLAIRLPDDIEARLDKLAKATGRTKTSRAREAVVEYLEDLEDRYLAEREYAKVLKGKSKVVALEQLVKRYGVEG